MSGKIYLRIESRFESYAPLIKIWSFITTNKVGQFKVCQSPVKEDYTKSILGERKKDKIYLLLYE
jgi:hypothetical protein